MKFNQGVLEHRIAFLATTEEIREALAADLVEQKSDTWGEFLDGEFASRLGTEEFEHQVNYCILFLSMFTRQATCVSYLNKGVAERLGSGKVAYIPAAALYAAAVMIQFPRNDGRVGISQREDRWIFAQSTGSKARTSSGADWKRGYQEPAYWADFRDNRHRFTAIQ